MGQTSYSSEVQVVEQKVVAETKTLWQKVLAFFKKLFA